MLYTLSHEIGHYIARWDAQDFKAISDFLFEHYGENVPVFDLLEAQKKKLKKSYEADGKAIPSEAVLEKEAHEELVCDMLSRMLADKNAYEKLMEQADPDRLALLEQVDVLVDGPFVESLKSYAALFRGSTNQRLIDMNKTRAQGKVVLWERKDTLSHFTVPEW